jgi:hypothetical protein
VGEAVLAGQVLLCLSYGVLARQHLLAFASCDRQLLANLIGTWFAGQADSEH